MVPPEAKSMAGLNTRTGVTVAPCAVEPTVMEVNVIAPVTAAASLAPDKSVSVLVFSVNPSAVAGRAPPLESPVKVKVWAPVGITAALVARAIEVLDLLAAVA